MAKRTRLIRKEEQKNIRRALIYIVLTLVLAFFLISVGIPLLIKMAIFLGNLRTSSKLPEKNDIIPPSPPRITVPFEATNSAQFSLEGYAEPGAKIMLYNSGLSFGEVIVDTEGQFKADNLKLTQGRNEITAVAQDEASNESQPSTAVIIELDTTPPALEIISPESGTTITGLDSQIEIKGKTEEKVKLSINERLVIIESEGNFNYQYSLKEGENVFKLVAQDEASNETEKELIINYSP